MMGEKKRVSNAAGKKKANQNTAALFPEQYLTDNLQIHIPGALYLSLL